MEQRQRAGRRDVVADESVPASPCVSLCTLDDDNTCVGCGRTLDEIVRWSLMGVAGQRDVLARLAKQEQRGGGGETNDG